MHWLHADGPYPVVPFGTGRMWDMGVTWAELQPTPTTRLDGTNTVVRRLDGIVATFQHHGVEPLLTLGMTPSWAARRCSHKSYGVDWGDKTCAPRDTSASSPWARYVAFVANRYRGRIHYFELWNEPSLANGWNDAVAPLARLQQVAQPIVHRAGAKLLSPGVPFTNGPPENGYNWLDKFLGSPGGTAFDITSLHLYPADAPVRAHIGPEWSVQTGLAYARHALAAHGVAGRPIWDVEHNVGRAPAHTGYQGTATGAAMIARTYVLATQNGIQRTIWYAADDRAWGGTWIQTASGGAVTAAGQGYLTVRRLLIGTVPLGCTGAAPQTPGIHVCRFGNAKGHVSLDVAWTTGVPMAYALPQGANRLVSATGADVPLPHSRTLTLSQSPVYVVGSL